MKPKRGDIQHIQQAVYELSDFINNSGGDDLEVFPELWLAEHRTLQQQFTGICMNWFRVLEKHGSSDGRNEASLELAKKLVPIIEEVTSGAARLPYI